MPRFQGSKVNRRENRGMAGKLVPGSVVGRLCDVVLEAGAVGRQVTSGSVSLSAMSAFFVPCVVLVPTLLAISRMRVAPVTASTSSLGEVWICTEDLNFSLST